MVKKAIQVKNPILINGTDVGYSDSEIKNATIVELGYILNSIILYFEKTTRQKTRNSKFITLYEKIQEELKSRGEYFNFTPVEIWIKKKPRRRPRRYYQTIPLNKLKIPDFFNDKPNQSCINQNKSSSVKTNKETNCSTERKSMSEINVSSGSSLNKGTNESKFPTNASNHKLEFDYFFDKDTSYSNINSKSKTPVEDSNKSIISITEELKNNFTSNHCLFMNNDDLYFQSEDCKSFQNNFSYLNFEEFCNESINDDINSHLSSILSDNYL